jgi:hypothetical protein
MKATHRANDESEDSDVGDEDVSVGGAVVVVVIEIEEAQAATEPETTTAPTEGKTSVVLEDVGEVVTEDEGVRDNEFIELKVLFFKKKNHWFYFLNKIFFLKTANFEE